MLTDKEIFDAVNEAPLGRTGQSTVISVGRAIEAAVLAKLGAQMLPAAKLLHEIANSDDCEWAPRAKAILAADAATAPKA